MSLDYLISHVLAAVTSAATVERMRRSLVSQRRAKQAQERFRARRALAKAAAHKAALAARHEQLAKAYMANMCLRGH